MCINFNIPTMEHIQPQKWMWRISMYYNGKISKICCWMKKIKQAEEKCTLKKKLYVNNEVLGKA